MILKVLHNYEKFLCIYFHIKFLIRFRFIVFILFYHFPFLANHYLSEINISDKYKINIYLLINHRKLIL